MAKLGSTHVFGDLSVRNEIYMHDYKVYHEGYKPSIKTIGGFELTLDKNQPTSGMWFKIVDTGYCNIQIKENIHNHDSEYSFGNHNHDAIYSNITHNHNSIYSLNTHNHNTIYANISHVHDDSYINIIHNHDKLYSKLNHDHDNYYALIGHEHNGFYKEEYIQFKKELPFEKFNKIGELWLLY